MLLDCEVSSSEVQALDSYIHECALPHHRPLGLPISQVIDELANSSYRVKITILLELWSLIYCDISTRDKEEVFMLDIANKWAISEAQVRRYKRWAKDFIDIITDGQRLINDN
jgi:hypothetical protein